MLRSPPQCKHPVPRRCVTALLTSSDLIAQRSHKPNLQDADADDFALLAQRARQVKKKEHVSIRLHGVCHDPFGVVQVNS